MWNHWTKRTYCFTHFIWYFAHKLYGILGLALLWGTDTNSEHFELQLFNHYNICSCLEQRYWYWLEYKVGLVHKLLSWPTSTRDLEGNKYATPSYIASQLLMKLWLCPEMEFGGLWKMKNAKLAPWGCVEHWQVKKMVPDQNFIFQLFFFSPQD